MSEGHDPPQTYILSLILESSSSFLAHSKIVSKFDGADESGVFADSGMELVPVDFELVMEDDEESTTGSCQVQEQILVTACRMIVYTGSFRVSGDKESFIVATTDGRITTGRHGPLFIHLL